MTHSRTGEKIVLEGEADQSPDQQPGDIVFHLSQVEHDVFKRVGADLSANIEISLAESLCGFSRVVLKHLDGRGISINHREPSGRVLRPGQIIKVSGEGMPYKKSDLKGDLYLTVDVKFPENGWLGDEEKLSQLQKLLPSSTNNVMADTVDEVDYDEDADFDDFGGGGEGVGNGAWVDDDEDQEELGPQQCTQQ